MYVLFLGDTVAVVAKINNASSRDMAPKFSLIQDVVYRAQGHTKHEINVIYKQVDKLMRPNTEKTAKCAVKIPHRPGARPHHLRDMSW